MRRTFFQELHKQMTINTNIWALTGDLGYRGFDQIKDDYPKRFVNCGASEQAMMDMAVGMVYDGKLPVVYSITPFLIYRAFETIKLYIVHEKLHVILVGSGRGKDYHIDGESHNATDIPIVLASLQGLVQYYPEDKQEIPKLMEKVIKEPLPTFISLRR